ncbi:MAG: tetratricopeptide repeat protein [Richelia sp.]|nr:tetratricopeptide repeat protein [Richelia sp.]
MESSPLDPLAIIVVVSALSSLIYFSFRTWKNKELFKTAFAFYQQKDYVNAEETFRQLISINSTNDLVHLLLGDTLMRQKKVDDAICKYKEVIERAPKNIDAYLRLANALLLEEKQQEAIDFLEKAQDYFESKHYANELDKLQYILQKIK